MLGAAWGGVGQTRRAAVEVRLQVGVEVGDQGLVVVALVVVPP